MLPKVIIHIATSLDGRIDGFEVNLGKYYELASTWKEDASLVGSNTILKGMAELPKVDEGPIPPPQIPRDDKRPLLVIPDSQGQIRCWNSLRSTPYWRDMVSLCSKSTPQEHLDYLRQRHVHVIIKGKTKVDLKAAMVVLCSKFKVKTVRVDSGGILNGALLRAGLVDEVSVLVHPVLVGGTSQNTFFRAQDMTDKSGLIRMTLFRVEKLAKGLVWLRYKIRKKMR